MHTTSSPKPSLWQTVAFAPNWGAVCGACLLVLAGVFPWMRLFFTPTSNLFEGAGGVRQEPIWFGVSLLALGCALFRVRYRYRLLSSISAAFLLKLWYAYDTLTIWFHLNLIEASHPTSDRAPIGTYGVGWYLLVSGCTLLIIALCVTYWREQHAS